MRAPLAAIPSRSIVLVVVVVLAVVVVVAGCSTHDAQSDAGNDAGAARSAWLDTPRATFPETLSEVGIYPDLTSPARVSKRAIAYAPEYPLWSNGGEKQRYLVLPEGATIDAVQDPWSFPEGTLFIKTFAFDDASGTLHNVETRVLRAKAIGWDYAAYLWDEDQTEARLLDGRTATSVMVSADGERFEHQVPSRRQCRECHESSPAFVLGFNAWQLDYAAPADEDGATLLERLDAAGVFESAPAGQRLREPDPETRWLEGYVAANCTHCHNGGNAANSAFDLRPDAFLANTVDRATESSASGTGVRIATGKPEQSVLYLGFTAQDNGTGIKAMPPLGVQRRDTQAAARLAKWVEAL